jgi:DNA polymerase V
MDPDRQKRLLALVGVGDVWGVGRRTSAKLKARGIHTALDLANADAKAIRGEFSVVSERTIRELNGVSCLDLECVRPTKQQIICSRSFGHKVTEKQELREAISKYTTRAAEKLRGGKRLCRIVSVFIRTSPHIKNEPFYSKTLSVELPNPTDDTRDLLEVSNVIFRRIWRAGYRYMKAGVKLADFYEHGVFQQDLFRVDNNKVNSKALMAVVDHINQSGLGNVFFLPRKVYHRNGQ